MLGVSESAMVRAEVVENPSAMDKDRAFGALAQEADDGVRPRR